MPGFAPYREERGEENTGPLHKEERPDLWINVYTSLTRKQRILGYLEYTSEKAWIEPVAQGIGMAQTRFVSTHHACRA